MSEFQWAMVAFFAGSAMVVTAIVPWDIAWRTLALMFVAAGAALLLNKLLGD